VDKTLWRTAVRIHRQIAPETSYRTQDEATSGAIPGTVTGVAPGAQGSFQPDRA